MAAKTRQADRDRTLLAYQPRRPVPWNGADLLAVILFYLLSQGGIFVLLRFTSGIAVFRTLAETQAKHAGSTDHVVMRLLASGDWWVFLLCAASAIIIAPVVEEFVFRVMLQGWLEAAELRWRRRVRWLRMLPRALPPILLSSLLFASIHYRAPQRELDLQLLTILLAADSVAKLLTLFFAIILVKKRVGATALDLGWNPHKLGRDVALGLLAFIAILLPVYMIQDLLLRMLPEGVVPDPAPLFVFALVLGYLYYRTHRIAPVVVLHAAFNSVGLLAVWLSR